MKNKKISFNETGLFSKLICDFVNSDLKLDFFNQSFFQLKDIKNHIKYSEKKDNTILLNVLKEQYKKTNFFNSKLSLIQSNINSLQNNNTYTVTTGHQLNICSGPLFLIYKIISVLAYTHYLNKNIDTCHFVPCFWMATEDHDFEEIKNIKLYGKDYNWNLSTLDAVGNLPTDSISIFLDQIRDVLSATENGINLLDIYDFVYTKNINYADATRALLTSFFGNHGLVVVDGNHPKLKQLFVNDLKEEVCNQFVYNTVLRNNNLIKTQYKPEINAMQANIFYLNNKKRKKIIFDKGVFSTSDSIYKWSKNELLSEIETYPERFSPNVLLRPLYQERVMNNLIYIGGPSELSYWLQLVIMFKERKQVFPFLALRSHFLILSKKTIKMQRKLGFQDFDLFIPYNKQLRKVINSRSPIKTKKYFQVLNELLLDFEKKFHSIDGFPMNSFYVFQKRFNSEFKRLESKILRFEKTKNANVLNQLKFINENIFPNNIAQERVISFIPYYLKYGPHFFDLLIRESSIFGNKYTILKEDE